jgi:hypothetical protein
MYAIIKPSMAMVAILAGLLAASAVALAAKPPNAGNGGGNGGGGGGTEPPDLGDLVVLYRDADGVPYLTPDSCVQPLPSATCPATCVLVPGVPAGPDVIPVDPATCAITAECATCTQEVDFGRINDARSPDTVFATQLDDVIVNLSTADCITQDPAGRLVTSRVDGGVVTSAAIDSPLQNLAIYKQLVLSGHVGTASGVVLPGNLHDNAARSLGAASDKTGEVNVDLVAYLNQIMGLADPNTPTMLDPKFCIDVKEEVKGVVQMVQKCYLNYRGYGYNRATNFGALPAPAYIPAGAPVNGTFEYLEDLGTVPPTFALANGPIAETVFPDGAGSALPGFTGGNIGGFAQAADDARAVIDYMHSWPVPGDYATPVPCVATGVTSYDVSISDQSGLQVPVRMVAGTEGREFTVTVANSSASPHAASGAVTVSAVDANGAAIATFPRVYVFNDLVPGASTFWTEGFGVDYRTTVTWTATVAAQYDVNPSNNSVTEVTTVTGTGGGGGGNRP